MSSILDTISPEKLEQYTNVVKVGGMAAVVVILFLVLIGYVLLVNKNQKRKDKEHSEYKKNIADKFDAFYDRQNKIIEKNTGSIRSMADYVADYIGLLRDLERSFRDAGIIIKRTKDNLPSPETLMDFKTDE